MTLRDGGIIGGSYDTGAVSLRRGGEITDRAEGILGGSYDTGAVGFLAGGGDTTCRAAGTTGGSYADGAGFPVVSGRLNAAGGE